jgi:uncharacterized protein YndB with AHSA1/START domain
VDVRSNRTFVFASSPDVVWAAITDPSRFPGWWPWLRTIDAGTLSPGSVWRCEVKPPLPWTLRFDLVIDDVCPSERVSATVRGDVVGAAVIDLAPLPHTVDTSGDASLDGQESDDGPAGCRLTLVSSLSPGRQVLAAAALVARPLVIAGHDWVIDSAARQFADRALHGSVLVADPDGVSPPEPLPPPRLDLRDFPTAADERRDRRTGR